MDVLVAQFLCLFGLFLSMITFTLLPMWIVPSSSQSQSSSSSSSSSVTDSGRRSSSGHRFVHSEKFDAFNGFANCLSGGVFLATFFIGLLPEVRHEMNDILREAGVTTSLPPTELVVVCGFFLAMFVEQFAVSIKNSAGHGHSHEVLDDIVRSTPLTTPLDESDDVTQTAVVIQSSMMTPSSHDHHHHHHHQQQQQHHHHQSHHHHHHHGHSHDVEALLNPSSSNGVSFGILFVSLGVHSLFEGMAIGLQTEVHILLNLFVGVWIHECLIAFALGFSMLRIVSSSASSKWRFVRIAVLFSALIPTGQLFGLVVGASRSWTSRVLNVVLQAIAAGTFIQVTFLDIIPEGLDTGRGHRAAKVALIFVGFLCIAVVTYFVQAHHAH